MFGSATPGTREKEEVLLEELVDETGPYRLIVCNDEVNTFEWVIRTLVELCGHTEEQAEQCAYIIHYKGKYPVKMGTYEELKPICEGIIERGIGATVEAVN